MASSRRTITLSLQPELADRMDKILKRDGRTRNALLRTALLRYIEECDWRQLLQYGEQRARDEGIGPEDVGALIEEFRARTDASGL